MSSTGHALGRMLAGSWRPTTTPADVSGAQLAVLAPLLVRSGAGALAWRRVRQTPLRREAAAVALQRAYLEQGLDAQLQESRIAGIVQSLRSHGIEALLIKGWAAAQLYPEPGLRPFGDVDLYIQPAHKAAAEAVLGVEVDTHWGQSLDVKTGLPGLYRLSLGDMFASCRQIPMRDTLVTVPCAEDHLRILCLHFLRHGAGRPLWLCDIAAAVEAAPASFDWDRCLGRNARRADWIACALGLAHQILEARVENTPIAGRARRLPSWLVPTVLQLWEKPYMGHQAPPLFLASMRRPGHRLDALRKRWPNPITAAMWLQAPPDLSPWPSQTARMAVQSVVFIGHLVGLLRQPVAPAATEDHAEVSHLNLKQRD